MQPAAIRALPKSYDLPPRNLPRQLRRVLPPYAPVTECSSNRLLSPTFDSQLFRGICDHRMPILMQTTPATESQAESPSGTPVRIAMVGRGSEELSLAQTRISANTTRTEAMIAGFTVMKIDSRVVDRGFGHQTGCAVKVFSCGEAVEGRFRVSTEYGETRTAAEQGRRFRDAGGESSSSSSLCHAQCATAQQMASFTSYLGCEAFLPLGMSTRRRASSDRDLHEAGVPRIGLARRCCLQLVLQPGPLTSGSQASTSETVRRRATGAGVRTEMGSKKRRSRSKRDRQNRRAISDSRVAGHGLADFSRSTPSYDTETSVSVVRVAGWTKWESHRARLDFAVATPASVGEVDRAGRGARMQGWGWRRRRRRKAAPGRSEGALPERAALDDTSPERVGAIPEAAALSPGELDPPEPAPR
ncbi:hypothetical protein DL98DRAFT_541549 [Cadophora sp. DSE1049]|nr:hypothetical protein DL98DRAFT_541549 [Cadophora sp. DSE1049]